MKIDLKARIETSYAITAILIAALFTGSLLWIETYYAVFETAQTVYVKPRPRRPMPFAHIERPKPKPVSMERLKTQGCVTDGLLSEYNPENRNFISLINRSKCYYLHRAIETWRKPPDFETVDYVMNQITKKDVVYGMFIAEAINTRAKYFNDYEKRYFDFKKMCRDGSMNDWGEGTCKPDFGSGEYQGYLDYITQKAVDLGVQSFMFGQIYMQENKNKDYAPEIVKRIRAYAKKKGVNIVIGAQTGAITDPKYLKLFDFIEGGVGLSESGNIEAGPCLSSHESCWALLWNERFSVLAKNVLLHLDWTGIKSDDLDIFTRMNQTKRAETLLNLYDYFTSRGMGFLMPFFGVLDRENGGCYGPKKRFYSPDMAYSCQDENAINAILAGKR
jgi:hypothetical protein